MATTLSDIRFIVEREIQSTLENELVINWCNVAQAELMLRIDVPGNTTLAIDTETLEYTLPVTIREIRRLRYQSDIDNGYNRSVHPVYTLYNGKFEVPEPFAQSDTLLIDYYAYLTTFTAITDEIDLDDRFAPLYTNYIKAAYYSLPSTRQSIGDAQVQQMYEQTYGYYTMIKKQVTDYYIIAIGTQFPAESGW